MRSSGRVIVGVTGSLRNMTALHTAAAAARESGRPLIAVTVWRPFGGEPTARRSPCPPLDEVWRADARGALADALATLPPGVDVETCVVRGRPGRTLLGLAHRPDDLLVVGSGRRGRFARLIHGAVSRYCLAHAQCPVLAVPEPTLVGDLDRMRRRLRRLTVPDVAEPPTQDASHGNGHHRGHHPD